MKPTKTSIMYSSTLSKLKQIKTKQTTGDTMIRMANNAISQNLNKKRTYEKLTLNSYLGVCVDVGQINRAFNLLLKYTYPKPKPIIDVQHYNVVLKGWAKLSSIPQIVETRMHMFKHDIKPNAETFAYILLGYSKSTTNQKVIVRKLVNEMRRQDIDPRKIFQATYLSSNERKAIKNLIKTVDPSFEDIFCIEPITHDCKLTNKVNQLKPVQYDFAGGTDLSKLESWAEYQRGVEWKSSITIKSIAQSNEPVQNIDLYSRVWQKLHDMWRKSLTKALDESLSTLQTQSVISDKIHLYPYLCSVDKNMIINILLDEIETNAANSNYSTSTNHLHLTLGNKIMIRYLRAKAVADGSHQEKQRIYNEYLSEYCNNPILMGKINSREFIQKKAIETKNYSIYKDRLSTVEHWPHHIVAAVGRFLYGLILREVKFDPDVVKNPKKEIKQNKLVHAFYTAYFQIKCSYKIKEEFRAHQEFENLHQKACANRLRFDYSFLPCASPPLPWLSYGFGGYLTNKFDLVRVASTFAEQTHLTKQRVNHQDLYPSLDSLNSIGLCPWIVNKEILDLVIELFRAGGDTELTVPLDNNKMEDCCPTLKESPSKADKILYNKEKKKYEQKRREMYSLWRSCLYRLSIANHFRERVFWFPHNMDFRGRTYPIAPHFNHLGSDLARSLLLFAKGQPLGSNGLDWLKIHLINLVGKMKSNSIKERLEYANSILHLEVLDSADNPWDGRRWWTQNENPWQVLACCKEIAKAIRSKDHTQYISHFPVHQDGSCNGLQHYAALGRDYGGAMAVNLIPCDKPQDVYSRVVDIVEKMRKDDVEKGVKIAALLDGFIQRKVIKQTVMTTVYGVTRYGARNQIARQLYAKGFPEKDVWQAAQYLATKTFESIGQMFNKSRLIQDWLTDCAFIIASRYKQPVSWNTPLGFPVVQPYTQPHKSTTNRLISTTLKATIPLYNDPLSRLNAGKQKTAFPPNYIHSLDSSHMMLTSLFCQQQGITFVSVHDCYWTHPNTVDTMNRICRQQFVALHSEPLLKNLSQQFVERFGSLENTTNLDEKLNDQKIYKPKLENSNKLDNEMKSGNVHKKAMLTNSTHSGGTRRLKEQAQKEPPITYYDKLVDQDLRSLIAEESQDDDELLIEEDDETTYDDDLLADDDNGLDDVVVNNALQHSPEHTSQPLIKVYDNTLQNAQRRSCATFMQVPRPGDLDLNNVLESTYFFS